MDIEHALFGLNVVSLPSRLTLPLDFERNIYMQKIVSSTHTATVAPAISSENAENKMFHGPWRE